MRRQPWQSNTQRFADAAALKSKRVQQLIGKINAKPSVSTPLPQISLSSNPLTQFSPEFEDFDHDDIDYTIFSGQPNCELKSFIHLFDATVGSDCKLHLALFWPHVPPPAVLPWMLREVGRSSGRSPLRTLFINMGRSALNSVAEIQAQTARLGARGVIRSGATAESRPAEISADAHFYMFLGNPKNSSIASVPIASIVPHYVALNDGIYWRDFDEKTLKGFKRHFVSDRLVSIRKYLQLLTSAKNAPSFAFLMPSHFDRSARKAALELIPGPVDLVVIDMGTEAVARSDVSDLIREIIAELEDCSKSPANILTITDCPLRFSFLKSAIKRRRNPGGLGNRLEEHRFVWGSREEGWKPVAINPETTKIAVNTIASNECAVATELWHQANNLGPENPLSNTLFDGAVALKSMALAATGTSTLLAPYSDTHDAYHRAKRERHSFIPHYNKALGYVADGYASHFRETIEVTLNRGLQLAEALQTETPLMRYLKRSLEEATPCDDILAVLRHPEDAQLTDEALLEYLTRPGTFDRGIPHLRVTTTKRYRDALSQQLPNIVIWAGSPLAGCRAYIGDTFSPREFRLLVAGQDTVSIDRVLKAALSAPEYKSYHPRAAALKAQLPEAPKDLGGLSGALKLDADRPRTALPFSGQGYLLLDGYGKVSAGTNSSFYVLDPSSNELRPAEARSIELGDFIFVMPDSIREELEALLREKDENGRTPEQAMVDYYKQVVKNGIDQLSRKTGKPVTAALIQSMLFEQNPDLPPISKAAIDYWLRAAEKQNVDTPHAANDRQHFEAFLKIMGGGFVAERLSRAIKVVRYGLRREGHANRALFDRLLLDPDSLIQPGRATFERLQVLRREAARSVFPLIEKQLENKAEPKKSAAKAMAT